MALRKSFLWDFFRGLRDWVFGVFGNPVPQGPRDQKSSPWIFRVLRNREGLGFSNYKKLSPLSCQKPHFLIRFKNGGFEPRGSEFPQDPETQTLSAQNRSFWTGQKIVDFGTRGAGFSDFEETQTLVVRG